MKPACVVPDCDRRATRGGGLCSSHGRRRAAGLPLDTPIADKGRLPAPERFGKYVDRSGGPAACWPWTGVLVKGYGQFRVSTTRKVGAHVYAWEQAHGRPVPDGLVLDHTCHPIDGSCRGGEACEHRHCVNPAHVEPRTRGDNSRRCVPLHLRT